MKHNPIVQKINMESMNFKNQRSILGN